jgi:hypothetical protein
MIPEGSVATWIIVLAVICGILILLLIVTALHKVKQPTFQAPYSELYTTVKTGLKVNLIRADFYLLGDNVVAPSRADIVGKGGIAPPFLPLRRMEMNAQIHAPAGLIPGKGRQVLTGQEAG